MSTNDHTLADFRTDHGELLDDLLTRSVAALVTEGLVDWNRVAHDGMRVRASAGAASFRRRPTLEEALTQAEAQVEALRAEAEEDPAASDRRQKGARERAARERAERIKAALGRLPELEARKEAGEKDKARCSTTDPEATVMKMADGGFRPAYNFQFSTATDGQVIVGVGVETTGSDAGQMVPMVRQVKERYETVPRLFTKWTDITFINPLVRSAGDHPRQYGDGQLGPGRPARQHGADLRHDLPRRRQVVGSTASSTLWGSSPGPAATRASPRNSPPPTRTSTRSSRSSIRPASRRRSPASVPSASSRDDQPQG